MFSRASLGVVSLLSQLCRFEVLGQFLVATVTLTMAAPLSVYTKEEQRSVIGVFVV
jgi:hypothetical protein